MPNPDVFSTSPWGAPGSSDRLGLAAARSDVLPSRGLRGLMHATPPPTPHTLSSPLPLPFGHPQARAPGRVYRGGRWRHARAADPRDTARPHVGAWPRAAARGCSRVAPRASCPAACPKEPWGLHSSHARPHNNHRSPLHGALEMRPHCVGEENGVAATLGSLPKAAHLAVFGDPHRPSTAPT